jgi:cell division protein FtsB
MSTHAPGKRTVALCLPLAILFFSGVSALGQSQDSQTEDLQQMKAKLQQLEQEMQALKGEISSVEHKEEAKAATIPVENLVQSNKSEPGEIPPQGKGNTLDLYGFVMLDSGYQSGQSNPNWFDVMRPTQLPAYANEYGGNGDVFFGVRQTRFGVKTSSPTALGDLKTQFEFELFGTGVDAGQTTFRLRQAWGELGQLLAGQTWSPFMDIDVFPNSLEYWGPNGMVFFRNVQIRWTPIRSDHTQLMFALERPGASADQGPYAGRVELANVKPRFNLPDISGHVRFTRNWGYFQVASIFRKIGWTDEGDAKYNLGGTAYGWGVNVSSNVKFTGNDTGRFQVIYGEGVENYMNDAPIDIGVKNNFGNPLSPIKGVPLPVLGVVAFLDHNWSERFSTSAGYSLVNISNSNAQLPSDFHQGGYALTNLLYHPVKPVTIGGEFQFGRRVDYTSGFNVNDYKVQFSFKYDWGKLFQF